MFKLRLRLVSILIVILFFNLSKNGFAQNYYSEHAMGWHWYDDPKEQEVLEKPSMNADQNDPNLVVDGIRKSITTALNKVIAEPTTKHLEHYIQLQEQLNNRAEKIADLWQEVLLKNPQLNYSLLHPTTNIGLKVYHEEESKEKEKAIRLFANQTGLFFFYRSTCSYCQRFAPILKNFAKHNGLSIIPITLDGISLAEFPNSKRDAGQAAAFQVKVTPSLFAVNPYTQKAFPIAYGLISETELRDNIYKAISQHALDNDAKHMKRAS